MTITRRFFASHFVLFSFFPGTLPDVPPLPLQEQQGYFLSDFSVPTHFCVSEYHVSFPSPESSQIITADGQIRIILPSIQPNPS